VVTLPKTIDNDIAMTDRTFGFDTALQIATEAIDRLHSTATSHERIIVVEVMGHRAGWLALEAGIAGGADVILLPEIPYDVEKIAEAIRRRTQSGKRFSIVVVAEGAMSTEDAATSGLGQGARPGGLEKDARRGQGEAAEISRRTRRPHHPADEEPGKTHRPGNPADHSRPLAARRHAIGRGPGLRHLARHRMRGRPQRPPVWRDARIARQRAETGPARKASRTKIVLNSSLKDSNWHNESDQQQSGILHRLSFLHLGVNGGNLA
jgi:hypothetical protein